MASGDWDSGMWQRASDLLQQVERIHRNFCKLPPVFSIVLLGRSPAWEPPVNLVETDESLWVISALPGVAADRMNVRLRRDANF